MGKEKGLVVRPVWIPTSNNGSGRLMFMGALYATLIYAKGDFPQWSGCVWVQEAPSSNTRRAIYMTYSTKAETLAWIYNELGIEEESWPQEPEITADNTSKPT